MIQLHEHGDYQLVETKNSAKILYLQDKGTYVWLNVEGIGEILAYSKKKHQLNCIIAQGKYRIYAVKDEPKLTDTIHLELFVGKGVWQGYLLLTGIPNSKYKRGRIIPTKEVITKSATGGLDEQALSFR
jgi:hypothetical protein